MKVGLFIPCYIDQFYPQVGIAVFQFLKKRHIEVDYPLAQTCCGQPLANSGMARESEKYANRFNELFSKYDYVVCPSGSCVLHVRKHFPQIFENQKTFSVASITYEFVEFLHDILKLDSIELVNWSK